MIEKKTNENKNNFAMGLSNMNNNPERKMNPIRIINGKMPLIEKPANRVFVKVFTAESIPSKAESDDAVKTNIT